MFGALILVGLACFGVLMLVAQAAKRPQVPSNKLATFLTVTLMLGVLSAVFIMRGKILFAIPTIVGAVACYLQYQRLSGQSKRDGQTLGGQPRGGQAAGDGAAMEHAEALAVLGLAAGATAETIKAAHRRLIEQLHPDKGGNDYLAAKINRARDILLKDLP
jgi:DnaJ domain